MDYSQLLSLARDSAEAHPDAPGLLRSRFISIDTRGKIVYDGFLSLVQTLGPAHPRVRKIMYFIWAMRDERIRRFIVERVADTRGRWRGTEITDKSNAGFFEAYLTADSAKKARSNYEFFLREAGIIDEDGMVHLGLSDGWLEDAMIILSERESDIGVKREMLQDPVGFLHRRGLGALINAQVDSQSPQGPSELPSWEPINDSLIREVKRGNPPGGQTWQPKDLPWGRGGMSQHTLDLVLQERATRAHQMLERVAASAIESMGYEAQYTALIDMYYLSSAGTVIFEMKSCNENNLHAQVRRAVSQLLEYRYLYQTALQEPILLAAVLETPPVGAKRWLREYLSDIGIIPVWLHSSEPMLVTSSPIPEQLSGIATQLPD